MGQILIGFLASPSGNSINAVLSDINNIYCYHTGIDG